MKGRSRPWWILAMIGVAIAIALWRPWASDAKRDASRGASSADSDRTSELAKSASAIALSSATSPSAAPSSMAAPAATTEFAKMAWGSGPRDIGRKRQQEGNAEGPMSLAVDSHGDALVLDQANGRLVRLGPGGTPLGTIKIGEGAQDVAVGKDGTIAVLDRLVDKNVTLYGADGRSLGTLDVVGNGIAEGGGVTGVFVDGNSVYVEREHGQLVRIGDTRGNTTGGHDEIPGRPTRDGSSYISAFLETGRAFVSATTRATMQHRYTRAIALTTAARGILLLDTDRFSTLYIATLGNGADGSDVEQLTCLALEDGHVLGSVPVTVNTLPEETFREFAVLEDGGVLHTEMSDEGVRYVRYDCR